MFGGSKNKGPQTEVRTYKNSKDYEKDAGKLAKKGWRVQDVSSHAPSRSLLFKLTFGLITMFFPKRKEIVVTYAKD